MHNSKQNTDLQLGNWPRTLLASAMLFWAINSIVGRALNDTVPPVALAFWRWFFAGALLLPFSVSALRRDWPVLRSNLPLLLLLSALGVAIFNTLLYTGLRSTTAVNALLLQALMPLMIVAISALFFRIYTTKLGTVGVIIAFVGVMLIIGRGDPRVMFTADVNSGDLIIFIGVVGVAVYTVLLKNFPNTSALGFLAATILIGTLQLAPFYLWELVAVSGFEVTWAVAGAIAYVAIFPSIVAYFGYNVGVQKIGANEAGLYVYLQPVFGSVLAILFLGESLYWYHGIGAAAIALGLALAALRRPR